MAGLSITPLAMFKYSLFFSASVLFSYFPLNPPNCLLYAATFLNVSARLNPLDLSKSNSPLSFVNATSKFFSIFAEPIAFSSMFFIPGPAKLDEKLPNIVLNASTLLPPSVTASIPCWINEFCPILPNPFNSGLDATTDGCIILLTLILSCITVYA